jgi:choline dehydrogenase-like flavoprotein
MITTTATSVMDAEILVIGSGAGGATTAAVLAEAGFDVLIVEEGEWVEQGSVVPFSLGQMDRQYRSGGVTVALGLPSIAYTEGCCAGGGTEINSALYRRPPEDVLQQWATDYRIADLDLDEVSRIADEVEQALNVTTVPGKASAPSDVLRRGAERLGWQNSEIPRWMKYPGNDHNSDPNGGQRQSMTRTYLPSAVAAGARFVTRCRIDILEMQHRSARRAIATMADGHRWSITFRHVFVCGGAIQSPALLQRSRIPGYIGRSLAVHPTVKLAARFGDELNVPDDVPVHQVKEFAPDLSFGGSASQPGLVALALSDQWDTFARAITDWRRISVYYAAITSEGRGRVRAIHGLRDPVVTYGLTRHDRALLGSGLARLALLMLEAGADEVYPSFRGAPVVRNRSDLATMQSRFSATRASVMTVHLCSTVPMGQDITRCGADSFGRVHGTSNVWVNDASLLPTAPGVNPQGTVMALAIRNARRFAATERAGG